MNTLNTKQIIALMKPDDIQLFEDVLFNERVYFLLKKWNNTPNCGWRNRFELLSRIKQHKISEK